VISSRVHLPLLDGLRGVAILMVLLCHFVYYRNLSPGSIGSAITTVTGYGWLGVDLFFVLSGFLITGILYDTKEAACYFKYFYARRALRIFPLYYTYLACVCLSLATYLWLRGYDPLFVRSLKDGAWASLYLTNIEIVRKGSMVTFAFGHFWSLAVEEQFYFIWPLVVLHTTGKQLKVLCLLTVGGAILARWAASAGGLGGTALVLMPCRADSLAMGAFIALAARNPAEFVTLGKFARYVFPVGLCALILCIHAAGEFIHLNLLLTAASFTFAGALALAITMPHDTIAGIILGCSWLRAFGKYSYGLYVLNQPFAFFPGSVRLYGYLAAHFHSELAATLVRAVGGIGLSFTAAWLSWHILEKRCLKLKKFFALDRRSPETLVLQPR
jgi:peptidoglycan/LPS O-acetylase OafA/YrhL